MLPWVSSSADRPQWVHRRVHVGCGFRKKNVSLFSIGLFFRTRFAKNRSEQQTACREFGEDCSPIQQPERGRT
jgi:hypothetical protein